MNATAHAARAPYHGGVAGVLDHDRIGKWSGRSDEMEDWKGRFEIGRDKERVLSSKGGIAANASLPIKKVA